MDWPRDWKKAYRELSEEHELLQAGLRGCREMLKEVTASLKAAQPDSEFILGLHLDIGMFEDALEVLTNLHAREYRDGTNWCHECLYEWPCRTAVVINEVHKQYGIW